MGNKRNKRNKNEDKTFFSEDKENLKISDKGSWCSPNTDRHSASFTKIPDIQSESESDEDYLSENVIVNLSTLQYNLDNMTVCSACKEGILHMKEDKYLRQGVVPHLYVECSNTKCDNKKREFDVQPKKNRTYELNRRIVLGARASGSGETAVSKMFAFMGLPPPPSRNSWNNHQNELADDIEEVAEENMMEATKELKELKTRLGECGSEESAEVAMSFDGSWNHVGHSGSFCVVYAVSVDTGKVIDFETRYKLCKMCKSMETKKGTEEYVKWKENHTVNCTKSHDGSSSSMEVACILDIFRRSIEKRGLKYTVFVGDGDSSSYRSVVKAQIYGPSVAIVKENCVGHVQKRMGTKLRKLITENKGRKLDDGKCLTGRGRLTQKIVDSFQVFYGIALRENKGNLSDVQQATRAIVQHYSSTPDSPSHELCPDGEDSWCKFQVDRALGTDTYRFPKCPLPATVQQEIEPVIRELSSETLLKTCQMGLTQNANESCHSMLWKLVPKRQYNSDSAYRVATAMTAGHWNSGQVKFNSDICNKIGINTSTSAKHVWRRLDRSRIRDGEYKVTDERRQRRKDLRKETLKMEDAFVKMEGKTYQSGEFCSQLSTTVRRCKSCGKPMKGHKRNACSVDV